MPFVANVRVGGQTRDWAEVREVNTHGYDICTRTRSLDATPFGRRFKFDMEVFNMSHAPEAFLQYSLVTHWYGAPGTVDNRPQVPNLAAEPLPQTANVAAFASNSLAHPVQIYRIPGDVEQEDVKDVVLSPGFVPSRIQSATLIRLTNGATAALPLSLVNISSVLSATPVYPAHLTHDQRWRRSPSQNRRAPASRSCLSIRQ